MNVDIITAVKNAIYQAVSGTTDHIYHLWLSDLDLLDKFTVVYEVNKESAVSTFDNPEFLKTYAVDVKLNCRDVNRFGNLADTIKQKVYNLRGTACKNVTVDGEELVYNDEYEIYTEFLRFKITV